MLEKLVNELIIPIQFQKGVDIEEPWVVNHLINISKLPNSLQRKLKDKGAKIILFNTLLTEQEEFKDLKGVKVKTYEDYYSTTWDNISSAYSFNHKTVAISNRSYYDAALHELGHCIDQLAVDTSKKYSDLDFIKNYTDKKGSMLWINRVIEYNKKRNYQEDELNKLLKWQYYKYPEEFFAHCTVLYYRDRLSNDFLKSFVPKMYELFGFIERRVESLYNK